MRFDAVVASALYSSAVLIGQVRADDPEDVVGSVSASTAESSTTTVIAKPSFTPSVVKAPFFEQFTDDWTKRWIPSKAKKEDSKADEEWAYIGEWAAEEPTVLKAIEGDKGLVVKNPAAHHAISAKFDKKIDNKGKTLVVQYEVKLQKGLECGGAYMKLLQDNKALHAEEFSNASPYIIMFGPDKCGSTNKVHFIFRHKNPKTGVYEEKHLKTAPSAKIEKLTNLYTLIIKPDQTFEIQINGESATTGSLFEDFAPPVNPEKEIDDSKDMKPDNWVDEARIADPEAVKPEDWDEEAPYEILDEEATKPADWLDDEASMIPDPEAAKPEDWDDEEDGDWIAPSVPNPKCEEASGCGKWEQPSKKNPAYKGKWTAPFVDNPAYKGVWKPRKIKNPDYFEDKTPANMEPMGAIGFEIWTMQSDILFDNIYIGHSIEDAAKLKAETFDIKRPIEVAEDEATKPKPSDTPKSPSDLKFMDDPILYVREKWELFLTIAKKDPIEAIKFVPEVAGGLGVVVVTLVALILGAIGMSSAPPPQVKKATDKVKDTVVAAKEQVASAVASGADKVQAEKRTTRSAAAE